MLFMVNYFPCSSLESKSLEPRSLLGFLPMQFLTVFSLQSNSLLGTMGSDELPRVRSKPRLLSHAPLCFRDAFTRAISLMPALLRNPLPVLA